MRGYPYCPRAGCITVVDEMNGGSMQNSTNFFEIYGMNHGFGPGPNPDLKGPSSLNAFLIHVGSPIFLPHFGVRDLYSQKHQFTTKSSLRETFAPNRNQKKYIQSQSSSKIYEENGLEYEFTPNGIHDNWSDILN